MKLPRLSAPRAAALALALGLGQAHAEIKTTHSGFELFLVVMDQASSQQSYVLDLGIDAMNFWVQGQQDTGASLFRSLDPATDSAFSSFLSSANLTTTRWMVLGFNKNDDDASRTAFTTLTNNNSVQKQRESFDKAAGLFSPDFASSQSSYINALNILNGANVPGGVKISTHKTQENGSSLATKADGNAAYFDKSLLFQDNGNGDGDCILAQKVCVGNPLGVSSWFYRLSPTLVDPADPEAGVDQSPIVFDEFDNLSGDGYWGFVKDPNSSKYILSYTLAGANPTTLVSTDGGRNRLSTIDYTAGTGGAHLIGIGADDVAFNVGDAVSAVPEPQNWALMLGGLAAFAGLRRVRRAKA